MKHIFLLVVTLMVFMVSAVAQYAPQAGLPGSTAITANSLLFTGWATQCTLQRGLMDIGNPSLGYASSGDSSLAIGASDGYVVSLGDSGVATLTFAYPIYNGAGADFAVFENGFLNTANDSQAFLELAFVEVSSDGNRYVRFPSSSLTQTNTQIVDPNDYLYANLLNNLAGSYIAHYGTPFDLQELADSPGIDISHITHVRIIDVIGSISAHSSYDNAGRIVNDPYPTPFPTGGFDLDAVGVLHQVGNAGIVSHTSNSKLSFCPNPVFDRIKINIEGTLPLGLHAKIVDVLGREWRNELLPFNANELYIAELPAGIYYLEISDANSDRWVEKFIKH